MRKAFKKFTEHVPYCVGKWLAKVPFWVRLGKVYPHSQV